MLLSIETDYSPRSVVLYGSDHVQSCHHTKQNCPFALLPPHLPSPEIPYALLRRYCVYGLLWNCLHFCNNLPVYTCSVLLESINPRRALYPQCTILDILRNYKYRNGLLHLVFANAIVVQIVFVEEEQMGDHDMFRYGWIVSQGGENQTQYRV
jgi:hypothetical protein